MAATTRTSALRVRVSPTRSNCFSCRKRSSLACSAGGQLADLVEEQRAALGRLDAPGLVAHRAGERALGVAEQLARQQLLGQRRAVDGDERAGRGACSAACSARASTPLPVPFSPRSSTGASACAARATISSTARIAGDARLEIDSGRLGARGGSPARPRARSATAAPSTLLHRWRICAGVNGLGR